MAAIPLVVGVQDSASDSLISTGTTWNSNGRTHLGQTLRRRCRLLPETPLAPQAARDVACTRYECKVWSEDGRQTSKPSSWRPAYFSCRSKALDPLCDVISMQTQFVDWEHALKSARGISRMSR